MSEFSGIDFWFDFVSPYGYLAATHIDALAARHDCEVRWHPFLIGATFKVSGRKALVQYPMVREYMYNDVQRSARLMGVALHFPTKFPVLTVNPARLFYVIHDQNPAEAKAFALAVYRAYFVQGRDIAKVGVVAEIAANFGIPQDRALALMKDDRQKQRLRDVVDAAVERNIFGSPMFEVDGELFWGVDRMDQLDRWLESGGW